jgi:hypothetical protein
VQWQLVERDERAMADHVVVAKRQLGEVRAIRREDQRRLMRVLAPRGEIGNLG